MSRDRTTQTADTAAAPETISWTLLDLDELAQTYRDVVAPRVREEGFDPESDRPSHEWLSSHGFRGLVYALREYHDLTFGEFWRDELGLEEPNAEYEWGIDHAPTVELLEAYLNSRRNRGNLSRSSEDTIRYRLAKYVRAYRSANDTDDLLTPVSRESSVPAYEATDAAWNAFDTLDEELAPRTMRRIHEAVEAWYAHLVRRKRAAVNPVSGLDDEYRWSRRVDTSEEAPANPALDPTHVQALYAAARTPAERLLVVALCAWGLRSGEVAALHRSQLVLDSDSDSDSDEGVSYIAFDERKNGPGEVSILYGERVAEDRLAELGDREEWNGYLFPSSRSASGHITRQTVLNRFDELARRADLPDEIAGHKPVPQMGRRFWYDSYSATQEAILAEVGEIAAEQGSASAEVVLREYLSAERRRTLRRAHMRDRLAVAFEDLTRSP